MRGDRPFASTLVTASSSDWPVQPKSLAFFADQKAPFMAILSESDGDGLVGGDVRERGGNRRHHCPFASFVVSTFI